MRRAMTCVVEDRAFAPGKLYRPDGSDAFATALDDCVVCLEAPSRFVVAPCGHAVCSSCAAKLGETRPCPTCRVVASADEMSTLELPESMLAEFRSFEREVAKLGTCVPRGAAGRTCPSRPTDISFGLASLEDGTQALLLDVPPNALRVAELANGLVFVLDESSSMSEDWRAMHAELRGTLEALCDGPTYVAFVSFSTTARLRVEPRLLVRERIDDVLVALDDFGGGMTNVDLALRLADETAKSMRELVRRDGANATPTIVVVTDGDPSDAERAALALARTEAPVHVVAYGSQYCFATCDRMFKYARKGGTSVLFARVERPSELVATLTSYGAHGLGIVGSAGARIYYNGAVEELDARPIVVDAARGIRVGFTGPVDVASLTLYGAALDVVPSVRHGMEVRDFLVATTVAQYAQKLALDRAGRDASAVLLRRARRLVPPTLASVLRMLDTMLEELERTYDSTAVGRTVSGVVRALTCPA
jgi:hypothetical protein